MLAMFFKENKVMTEEQTGILKHWFFYTTYSSYFTNTSLANIRKDIETFMDFSKGKVRNPMREKQQVALIDQFPDILRLGAVRSCGLLLTTILPRITTKNSFRRLGFFIPAGLPRERKVGNAICYVNERQKKKLRDLFSGVVAWDKTYEKFYLTEKSMKAYYRGDYKTFENVRKNVIKEAEKYKVSVDVEDIMIV